MGTASPRASALGTASTINSDGAPCDIIQASISIDGDLFTATTICLRARSMPHSQCTGHITESFQYANRLQ